MLRWGDVQRRWPAGILELLFLQQQSRDRRWSDLQQGRHANVHQLHFRRQLRSRRPGRRDISTPGGEAFLTNCIFWENHGGSGTITEQQIYGSAIADYCCIEVETVEPYPGDENISSNPLLRGSPNWNDLDDDTRLLPNSPCIDKGNPDQTLIPDDDFDIDNDLDYDEKIDLDLELRIVGPVVDMGAYEFYACVGDIIENGVVDIDDFLLLLAEWGPCDDPCPPSCAADLDDDCNVGITDFLLLLANWGCGEPYPDSFPESGQECIDRYWPDIGRVATCITALNLMP